MELSLRPTFALERVLSWHNGLIVPVDLNVSHRGSACVEEEEGSASNRARTIRVLVCSTVWFKGQVVPV